MCLCRTCQFPVTFLQNNFVDVEQELCRVEFISPWLGVLLPVLAINSGVSFVNFTFDDKERISQFLGLV